MAPARLQRSASRPRRYPAARYPQAKDYFPSLRPFPSCFLLASAAMDAARPIMPDESGAATETAARVTPMMEQYTEIKAANPDCLLFYRMGDFYELFFDDAEVASRALGIALTKRVKHLGSDIPMCGVPIHAADQ